MSIAGSFSLGIIASPAWLAGITGRDSGMFYPCTCCSAAP